MYNSLIHRSVLETDDTKEYRWHYKRENVKGVNIIKMYLSTFILSNFLLLGIALFSPIFIAWFIRLISSTSFIIFWMIYFSTYFVWSPHLHEPASYSKLLSYGSFWEWAKFYVDWKTISVHNKNSDENIKNKQYLFAVQPHAILIFNRIQFYGNVFKKEIYSNPTMFAAATPIFYIPGCRECSIFGQACSANRKTLKKVLKSGESVCIWIGGSRELMRTNPNSTDTEMVILDRKGFIKLAVTNGIDIVPCLQFGEKWIYRKYSFPNWLKSILYTIKIPGITFLGRFCTFLPFQYRENGKPIRVGVVLGEPISIEKKDNVDLDDAYIDEVHAKYMTSMKNLFHKYKHEYLYEEQETLTFVRNKKLLV